jgi:hypothetical protein
MIDHMGDGAWSRASLTSDATQGDESRSAPIAQAIIVGSFGSLLLWALVGAVVVSVF